MILYVFKNQTLNKFVCLYPTFSMHFHETKDLYMLD